MFKWSLKLASEGLFVGVVAHLGPYENSSPVGTKEHYHLRCCTLQASMDFFDKCLSMRAGKYIYFIVKQYQLSHKKEYK